ncbi:MAG: hypothetical protein GEV07_14465 [Streptosporangiales bacterium]|nr:hypothetical protein [Streptosporangiales bacterium]
MAAVIGPNDEVVTPTAIALVQVVAIASGHIGGVIAAQDRAVRVLPGLRAVAGQVPLLVLMVG